MSQATFNQRRALFNMHSALGWTVKGIRDMSFEQASAAIDKAKKAIQEKGFARKNDGGDGLGDDCGEW
jgi:hypothetical protein